MTPTELAQYNGNNGHPSYVAVDGIIYDVSKSPMWTNGTHAEIHQAGQDLSLALKKAPHIAALIERFPSVGRLDSEAPPVAKGSKMPLVIGGVIILAVIGWFLSH